MKVPSADTFLVNPIPIVLFTCRPILGGEIVCNLMGLVNISQYFP